MLIFFFRKFCNSFNEEQVKEIAKKKGGTKKMIKHARSIRRTVEDFDEIRPKYLDPTATVLSGNAEIEDFSYLDQADDWWVREGWTAKASTF